MPNVYANIMVVSIATNWCLISYNLLPRLGSRLLSRLPGRWTLTLLVTHLQDKPHVLAKILTDQLVIWTLIVASAVAICTSDIIQFPFHPQTKEKWNIQLAQVIFAVNIGRYLFDVVQPLFSKQHKKKARYRVEIMHHAVTLLCYSLFLGYTENSLLGLVGVLMETTCIFEELVRLCKEISLQHTLLYKRILLLGAVFNVSFRGIIPTAFLINAMFHQSPFTMSYPTLMIFFLSIIFFSVINVWQILASLQRLLKFKFGKSDVTHCPPGRTEADDKSCRTNGGMRSLLFPKNNLGYTRPYDNKNIAVHYDDSRQNVENRKVTAKDTLELQIDPVSYIIKTVSKSCSNENDNPSKSNVELRLYVKDDRNCDNDLNAIISTTNRSLQTLDYTSRPESPVGVLKTLNSQRTVCPSPNTRVTCSSMGCDLGTLSTEINASPHFRQIRGNPERIRCKIDETRYMATGEDISDWEREDQRDISETAARNANNLRDSSSSADSSTSEGPLLPLSPKFTHRKHVADPQSSSMSQLHNVCSIPRTHVRRSLPCGDLSKVTSLRNSFKLDPVCNVASVSQSRTKLESITFDA